MTMQDSAGADDDMIRLLLPAARAQARDELIDDCARPGPLHDLYCAWIAERGRPTMPTRFVEWLAMTDAPVWRARVDVILATLHRGIAGDL